MESRFILENEDIVVLGESDDTSSSMGSNSPNGGNNSTRSDESTTKSINGGPGSGNFGHAGRPGEVGGSAPSGSSRPDYFDYSSYLSPEDRQKYLDRLKKDELLSKTARMRSLKAFDEAHIEALREVGFTEEDIKRFKEKVLARQIVDAEKNDKRKELRQRAKDSPEQTKAIDNIVSKIKVDSKDETWLRNNCSPEMAQAFSEEVDHALEMGIENIHLRLNDAKASNGSMGYTASEDRFDLTISKEILRDWEATLETRKQKGPDGSKWWTNGTLNGTFAHEFGHSMEWQFIKKYAGSMEKFPQTLVASLYDYAAKLVVHDAIQNMKKSGVTLDDLRANQDKKYISKYGRTNAHEAIAESFGNPNYSDFTKEVYDITMGKTKMSQERVSKLRESIRNIKKIVKGRYYVA